VSKAASIFAEALKEGRRTLLEPEAKTICREFGMPVAKFEVAKDLDEALTIAGAIGYPVAVKAVSPQLVHKSDAGAVVLNIGTPAELQDGWNRILTNISRRAPGAKVVGILVEKMAPPGVEVIIGGMKDRQFGHVVMFGLGGIFVEALKDVSFRAVPITAGDALEMISEVKGYPVLKGARGGAPVDAQALVEILLSASRLLELNPQVTELDLNPVIASAAGATVVDARLVIGGP
jgi:acetyl-CoA synthetase (ADP-forming)